MNIESFRIAFSSLATNRSRAILTALGIIIGVAAVVSLIGLGRGIERYVASQFEALGANTLTVTSAQPRSDTRTEIRALTMGEAADIANPEIAPHVAQVALEYSVAAEVVAGSEQVELQVSGVSANYNAVNDWFTLSGSRFITQEDIDTRARVAVLGVSTVEDLFGERDYNAIGLPIEINDAVFSIIGVMEERSGASVGDLNAAVFIPISTAQTRLDNARVRGGDYAVSQIQVKVASQDNIDAATEEIETYLTGAHEVMLDGEEDFSVGSQGDLQSSVSQITGILTIFLGVVAGISLLVGGIGIMNIMLVSVTERTREIGLRKAVGAQSTDILGQFLVESALLSLVGGALGIAIGALILAAGGALIPDLQLAL
ncbi:MAG: ABC transporter permease, partial [Burkholderiales bacterium]|nr:ABC transporter permease [Anaerolineae bacterium]